MQRAPWQARESKLQDFRASCRASDPPPGRRAGGHPKIPQPWSVVQKLKRSADDFKGASWPEPGELRRLRGVTQTRPERTTRLASIRLML